jgi:hypothetical protein
LNRPRDGQESEHLEGWAMSSKKFAHWLFVLGTLLALGICNEMSAKRESSGCPDQNAKELRSLPER